MPKLTPSGNTLSSVDLVAMTAEVKEWITAKGWDQDNRSFGDECMLLISEISEALEAYREGEFEDLTWSSEKLTELGISGIKPTGVGSELADVLVRLLDTCSRHNIDLGEEFRRKMDYNWTRSYRHGSKKL